MDVKVINGTSKSGKSYKCLEVQIGVYKGRFFPSPAELAYIESQLATKAYQEFINDEDTNQ